jgi:hypothetical protein
MKLGPAPIKPWYFKDGAPLSPEAIRRVVGASGLPAAKPEPIISRRLIMAVARYYARKVERYLSHILLAEIEDTRRRMPLTGDAALDAKRLWRRMYQREYRHGVRRTAK